MPNPTPHKDQVVDQLLATIRYAYVEGPARRLAEANLASLVEQLETLRELNDRVIRERDEGHAENERLNEQLEALQGKYDYVVEAHSHWKELAERFDREKHRLSEQLEAEPFKSVSEWRARAEQAEATLAFQHQATAELEEQFETLRATTEELVRDFDIVAGPIVDLLDSYPAREPKQ